MKTLKFKMTLVEEMLGTSSNNPEIHQEFISSKAPNAESQEEEIAALGVDAVMDKAMTIFPKMNLRDMVLMGDFEKYSPDRLDAQTPFMWDYQVKGFFKDACGMLWRVKDTKSSKQKAYKKVIDGLIFPKPRRIPILIPEGLSMGVCQRPIRVSTMQGERVALVSSETVPAGSTIEFEVNLLDDSHESLVLEWLEYASLRGLGQWRNSGKGRATFKQIDLQ